MQLDLNWLSFGRTRESFQRPSCLAVLLPAQFPRPAVLADAFPALTHTFRRGQTDGHSELRLRQEPPTIPHGEDGLLRLGSVWPIDRSPQHSPDAINGTESQERKCACPLNVSQSFSSFASETRTLLRSSRTRIRRGDSSVVSVRGNPG